MLKPFPFVKDAVIPAIILIGKVLQKQAGKLVTIYNKSFLKKTSQYFFRQSSTILFFVKPFHMSYFLTPLNLFFGLYFNNIFFVWLFHSCFNSSKQKQLLRGSILVYIHTFIKYFSRELSFKYFMQFFVYIPRIDKFTGIMPFAAIRDTSILAQKLTQKIFIFPYFLPFFFSHQKTALQRNLINLEKNPTEARKIAKKYTFILLLNLHCTIFNHLSLLKMVLYRRIY